MKSTEKVQFHSYDMEISQTTAFSFQFYDIVAVLSFAFVSPIYSIMVRNEHVMRTKWRVAKKGA